jgi:type II secretory pathway component PulF
MPRYQYIGIDIAGRRVTGEREAPDPDALLAALGNEVLFVESIQIADPHSEAAAAEQAGARMKAAVAAELGGHLSGLIEGEVPLESGLEAIAAETASPRMKRTLRGLAAELARGTDLATALDRSHAPVELRALVRAGARSGNIGQILEHYSTNAEGLHSLRQSVLMGLFYPALLLLMFTVLMAFFLGWIVPEFSKLYVDFDLDLPWITSATLKASYVVRDYGPWIALTGIVGLVAVLLLLPRTLGRVGTRRWTTRVPLLGPILRWMALSRFSRMLALLVENEISLDEALPLAAGASNDPLIEEDCRKIRESARAGEALEAAARRQGGFPPSFVQALSWERRSTGLPDVLQSIGEMYASRARGTVSLIIALVPPILLVFLGIAMFVLIVALFMPLIELLRKLS